MVLTPTEERALLDLYRRTDGENWTRRGGWGQNEDPCMWHGITCERGHVTRVVLPRNGLTGTLPQSLGLLVHLEALDLTGNRLVGPLPPSIGHLRRLEVLELGENALAGALPSRLRLLLRLRTLDLHENRLSGPIPGALGDLVRLERLALSHNALSGELPPELGNLHRLTHLYLQGNPLQGPLPVSLMALDALHTFIFSETELLERPEPEFQQWLANIPYLESSGVLYAEVVQGGDPLLTLLAAFATLGASFLLALLMLPFLGPLVSALAGVAGIVGTGVVARKVYQVTGGSRGQPALSVRRQPALTTTGLREELHRLVRSGAKDLPPDIQEGVRALEARLHELLPRIPEWGEGAPETYIVRQTIRDYLPRALENYRALPEEFARSEPLQEGQTAHELLLRQLEILQEALQEIGDDEPQAHARELLIHGRFLEGKFERNEDF